MPRSCIARVAMLSLLAALRSEDLATLHFREQRFVTGTLRALTGSAAGGLLTFQGPFGAGERGKLSQVCDAVDRCYHLPFGPLADNRELRSLGPIGTRVHLRFASGAKLEGELASTSQDDRGQLLSARLLDYRLECERAGVGERGQEYVLFVAPSLLTAHAGTLDPSFYAATEPTGRSVPKPRELATRERALLSLYERAIEAFRNQAGSSALPVFQAIHRELAEAFRMSGCSVGICSNACASGARAARSPLSSSENCWPWSSSSPTGSRSHRGYATCHPWLPDRRASRGRAAGPAVGGRPASGTYGNYLYLLSG